MNGSTDWPQYRFGLIVTGEAEEKGISGLFKSLTMTGLCSFSVICRIHQSRKSTNLINKSLPVARVVRTIKPETRPEPDKDELEISYPAKKFLNGTKPNERRFVILLDDLEHDRLNDMKEIFEHLLFILRKAMNDEQRTRASVHFLVMMMEAYFFADAAALKKILNLDREDYKEDVEMIRNPKSDFKDILSSCNGISYKETEHGVSLLKAVNIEKVLSNPKTCASLRSLFKWCVSKLNNHPQFHTVAIPDFKLADGIVSALTDGQ